MDTPAFALTSEEVDLGHDAANDRWVPGDGATDVRLEVTSTNDGPVFVGVGPTAEVDRYLSASAHAKIVDFEVNPFRPEIRVAGGSSRPAAPASQTFWSASVAGTGTQTLIWPARSGSWTVVVMNADAAARVSTHVAVGAKTGLLLPIGLGLAGVGIVLFAGGIALVVLRSSGGRGRKATPPAPPEQSTSLLSAGRS